MLKKGKFIILICFLCSFLSCQPYYQDNINNEVSGYANIKNNNHIITSENLDSEQSDMEVILEDEKVDKEVLVKKVDSYLDNQEPITFQTDTEDNNFYTTQIFAASEKGFYFLKGRQSEYVWFYDAESGRASILCSRADCSHGEDCDAYRDCEEYCMTAIFYYEHKIFMIANGDDGGFLDSWDEDGSNYKRIIKLWDKNILCDEAESFLQRTEIIHNNYMYYLVYDTDNLSVDLCRIPLDGSNKQEILVTYAMEKMNLLSQDLYANGDDIYIVISRLKQGAQIKKYNIQNDSLIDIYNGLCMRIIGLCFIDNYVYCYERATGLIRIDKITYEIEIIMDAPYDGSFQLTYDGEFIYLSNLPAVKTLKAQLMGDHYLGTIPKNLKYMIYILDKEGELIDNIIFQGEVERIVFGDSRYIVALQTANENVLIEDNMAGGIESGAYVTVYDKRLIGSEYNLWRAISSWNYMIVNTY